MTSFFLFKFKKILWKVTSENISNAMFDIIEIHFMCSPKRHNDRNTLNQVTRLEKKKKKKFEETSRLTLRMNV